MYNISAEEIVEKVKASGTLPMSALSVMLSSSNEGLGEDVIDRLTDRYLAAEEVADKRTYEFALSAALSAVEASSGKYVDAVRKLLDAGQVEPFIISVLSQPRLPDSLIKELIPIAAVKSPQSFFSQGSLKLTGEHVDLFGEAYVHSVLEDDEKFNEWVNKLGFDNLYRDVLDSRLASADVKGRFEQLFLIWRSRA